VSSEQVKARDKKLENISRTAEGKQFSVKERRR